MRAGNPEAGQETASVAFSSINRVLRSRHANGSQRTSPDLRVARATLASFLWAEVSTEVSGKLFPPGVTGAREGVIPPRLFARRPESAKRRRKPTQFQYTTGQTGKRRGSSRSLRHCVTPPFRGTGAGLLGDEWNWDCRGLRGRYFPPSPGRRASSPTAWDQRGICQWYRRGRLPANPVPGAVRDFGLSESSSRTARLPKASAKGCLRCRQVHCWDTWKHRRVPSLHIIPARMLQRQQQRNKNVCLRLSHSCKPKHTQHFPEAAPGKHSPPPQFFKTHLPTCPKLFFPAFPLSCSLPPRPKGLQYGMPFLACNKTFSDPRKAHAGMKPPVPGLAGGG